MAKMEISGWGNSQTTLSNVVTPSIDIDAQKAGKEFDHYIPRGAGRSYGDAAIGSGVIICTGLRKTICFDKTKGVFICQSGKTFQDILREIVPEGYFLHVTPGTKHITVGGAIAADVHGKNHHKDGCFSSSLNWIELSTADNRVLRCSRTENTELFWATCGGMGLTGFILRASFNLRKIFTSGIINRTIQSTSLDDTLNNLIKYQNYNYSVAWLDCTATKSNFGRSLLYLGEHATTNENSTTNLNKFKLKKALVPIPFKLPPWLVNNTLVRIYNAIRYNSVNQRDSTKLENLVDYFYPLDTIKSWNKLYGSSGFYQYQVLIPFPSAIEGIKTLLNKVEESTERPLLVTAKLMGEQNDGWLSFPQKGIALALDFKRNESAAALMETLDDIATVYKGRGYLAKDARMSREFFQRGYPKLEAFKALLRKMDPNGKMTSNQSARLGITLGSKNALILGGTSDIGKAIGLLLSSNGYGIINAVRDPVLDTDMKFDATDFKSHSSFIRNLPVIPDIVVVAFGVLNQTDECFEDPEMALQSSLVNYSGAISILGHLSKLLVEKGGGTIVGVSSVAGERGRPSNYVYGSSKAGLTAYLEGLRLHLRSKNVHVLTVKPGYVKTKMTANLKLPKTLTASPEQVAMSVFNAIEKRRSTVYILPVWRYIMIIIRSMPDYFIMKLRL